MKSRAFSVVFLVCAIGAILCAGVVPAFALDSETQIQPQYLDAESIATRSLTVAESMRTSGYCYAGVSKALSPLGVVLTGAAAYEAREQLLVDSRFAPVSTDESVDLHRGDIIVFNKSISHPYGHICVYQGNGQESSDHVSSLSNPDKYGGFTVFRLRSNGYEPDSDARLQWIARMPISAPDFRQGEAAAGIQSVANMQGASSGQLETGSLKFYPTGAGKGAPKTVSKPSGGLKDLLRKELHVFNKSSEGKSLKNRLVRFVMSNW